MGAIESNIDGVYAELGRTGEEYADFYANRVVRGQQLLEDLGLMLVPIVEEDIEDLQFQYDDLMLNILTLQAQIKLADDIRYLYRDPIELFNLNLDQKVKKLAQKEFILRQSEIASMIAEQKARNASRR